MANENGKKVSTSVSLPVELDDALDAFCELYSCSRSGVIVQALIDYFARWGASRRAARVCEAVCQNDAGTSYQRKIISTKNPHKPRR